MSIGVDSKITQFCEAYHVKDITTDAMQDAIEDWYDLYFGNDVEGEDSCQRIPYAVVTKLTQTIFSEYEAKSEDEFAQSVIKALNKKKKKATQAMLIGGAAFLKPLIFDEKLSFVVIPRNNAIILGRNEHNEVTDIGTIEETEGNGRFYTFFERRRVNEDGNLEIDSRLYVSEKKSQLGNRIPLATLSKYEDIDDINIIPIGNIGLIPLLCPVENCVDGSDDAVSVYASAVGLIHNINENEYQLKGEFRRGESRVFVSNDLIKRQGDRVLNDNVFVGLDDDPEAVPITTFSPQLREQSFLARKKEYLRNVETVIGFKRGILSDVEAQERTATEVTSSAGDYNLTIIDFQQAFEEMLRNAIKIVGELLRAYRENAPEVDDDKVIVNWGNGILYDKSTTWSEYMTMVQAGMLKPEIAVAYYFNLPWETEADINKIRNDYMPEMVSLLENA